MPGAAAFAYERARRRETEKYIYIYIYIERERERERLSLIRVRDKGFCNGTEVQVSLHLANPLHACACEGDNHGSSLLGAAQQEKRQGDSLIGGDAKQLQLQLQLSSWHALQQQAAAAAAAASNASSNALLDATSP